MATTKLIWFKYDDDFGKTVVKSPGTVLFSYDELIGEYKSEGSESGRYGIQVSSKEFGQNENVHVNDCVQGSYGLSWEIKYWDADLIMPNNQLKIFVRGTSGSSCSQVDWEKVVTFIPYEGWMPSFSVSLAPLPSFSFFSFQSLHHFLSPVTLSPPPSLSVFLLMFPRQPLADAIVFENMNALAEASFEHHRRVSIPNFNAPPFICLICGKTFNTIDDYISHLISHVQAYEEPEE